jgi:hypothetical protein
MIILGVILLVLGVIGVVLFLLGTVGHPVAGRQYWY